MAEVTLIKLIYIYVESLYETFNVNLVAQNFFVKVILIFSEKVICLSFRLFQNFYKIMYKFYYNQYDKP